MTEVTLNSNEAGTSHQLLSALRLCLYASFKPRSAFHSFSISIPRRTMAFPALLFAILASSLVSVQVAVYATLRSIESGEIVIPSGISVELFIGLISQTMVFLMVSAIIITWLSMAAISYFLSRLMGYELHFSSLLTLSAFTLMPNAWIMTSIGLPMWVDPNLATLIIGWYQGYLSLPISIVTNIWSTIIQTYVLRGLTDISTKRAFLIALLTTLVLLGVGMLGGANLPVTG
jgi:hypothetical protein